MKLAMPKPCGIRSIQRCKADVLSFQQLASTLAEMAMNDEARVNAYNFPVLRISLFVGQLTVNGQELKILPSSKNTAKGNCNLTMIRKILWLYCSNNLQSEATNGNLRLISSVILSIFWRNTYQPPQKMSA